MVSRFAILSMGMRAVAGAAGVAGIASGGYIAFAKRSGWPTAPEGDYPDKVVTLPNGRLKSVFSILNYQKSDKVKPSLVRNGKVYTARDTSGTDGSLYGVAWDPTYVEINNARALPKAPKLTREGFEIREHDVDSKLGSEFDFFDNNSILTRYYPSVEEMVKEATGASRVYAFDHNIRSATGSHSKEKLKGGSSVQGPAHIVHTDYTLTSSKQRLIDLSNPPKVNDTWKPISKGGNSALIPKEEVKKVLSKGGRFAIINVWRNTQKEPVQVFPLAVANGRTTSPEDLVTFEIRYSDRTGENYFVRSPERTNKHRWFYFPRMEQHEALVFKQWDSNGNLTNDAKIKVKGNGKEAAAKLEKMPPQFCIHTAFKDPTSPVEAPDRQSIEVRCMALFLPEDSGNERI
ncbi:hypothetical protein AAMO2058_000578400 [Amorphochlora amoebiformis]